MRLLRPRSNPWRSTLGLLQRVIVVVHRKQWLVQRKLRLRLLQVFFRTTHASWGRGTEIAAAAELATVGGEGGILGLSLGRKRNSRRRKFMTMCRLGFRLTLSRGTALLGRHCCKQYTSAGTFTLVVEKEQW